MRSPPLRLLLVVLVAILFLVAGCRLTADEDPRRIPSEQLPADLVDSTTTTVPPSTGGAAQPRPGVPSAPRSSASRLLAQSATGSSATRS
jgi:hypothetical protein